MYYTILIDFEVDFSLFYFFYSFSHIGSYRTALGVRHQTTGAQYTSQSTDFTHDSRHRNDYVDIGPTAFDFLDILVQASASGVQSTNTRTCFPVPWGNDTTPRTI